MAACAKLLRRQLDRLGPADGNGDPVAPVAPGPVEGEICIADQRFDARGAQARVSNADAPRQRRELMVID